MVIKKSRFWSLAGFLLLPPLLLITIQSSVAEKGDGPGNFRAGDTFINQDEIPHPPPPDEGVSGSEIDWANVSMLGSGPTAEGSSIVKEVSPVEQSLNAPQPEPQPVSPPAQIQGPGENENSPAPPDPGTGSVTTYIVQRGDTLFQISVRYGVPQNVLAAANNIGWVDLIYAGQELIIPGGYRAPAAAAPVQPTAAPQPQRENPNPIADQAAQTAAESTYVVQSGDSLGTISWRFGVDMGALITANGLVNPNYIQAGQTLVIPAAAGPIQETANPQQIGEDTEIEGRLNEAVVADTSPAAVEADPNQAVVYTVQRGDSLLVIAGRHGVTLLDLLEENELADPNHIYPGQLITIPSVIEDESTTSESVESTGPEAQQPAAPARFIWPVENYQIVNYYWAWHPGIDLVVDVGTPVVASAAGEVEYSGWNAYGYGYVVIINHGGGVRTLYAHNSELLVEEGERVKQGQTISLSGSTGMSNWPHVHLEIIFDERYRVNPCDQLPGACLG